MKKLIASLMIAATSLSLVSCNATPKNEAAAAERTTGAQDTIAAFKAKDPTMANLFNSAHGYAVFTNVGKGGLIVGGAHGKGEVWEQGRKIGWAQMSQATIGAQIGGQSFDEIIFFESKEAMDKFKRSEFEVAPQASAVAAASGAGANARYENGVMIFTLGEKGLMVEAAVGGQKFKFEPLT